MPFALLMKRILSGLTVALILITLIHQARVLRESLGKHGQRGANIRNQASLLLSRDEQQDHPGQQDSLQQQTLPLCTREQVRKGRWVAKRYHRMPYLPKQLDSKSCYTEMDLQRPWDTYIWNPTAVNNHQCEFAQWSSAQFCSVAFNQTIAFIGDSLTLEHYSALIHMLGVTDFEEERTFDVKGPTKFDYRVCPHQETRLLLFRNNWLFLNGVRKVLTNEKLDVVLLNRGSWYQTDDKLLKRIQDLIPVLDTWQKDCRQQQQAKKGSPKSLCQIIWRTTVPGHPQCSNYTTPATNREKMEELIADFSSYSDETIRYHWYDFQHQNQLVMQMFQNATYGKTDGMAEFDVDIMDAYDVNLLRPDDHVARNGKKDDCLHNCQPGKTLVYNDLLLHLMLQKRERDKQSKTD